MATLYLYWKRPIQATHTDHLLLSAFDIFIPTDAQQDLGASLFLYPFTHRILEGLLGRSHNTILFMLHFHSFYLS